MELSEEIIAAVSFGALVAYHLHLTWRIRTAPLTVTMGLARRIRSLWVHTLMAGKLDILAIQTLRNWTMGATFLASASILLGLGAFNLALSAGQNGDLSTLPHSYWMVKLGALGIDFFASFFCFTISVRYFNHVGMMINVLDTEGEAGFPPEAVQSILERGAVSYSVGMRLLYLTIPLVMWMFGPWWLAGSSAGLLMALVWLDRGL
ncbi:MAG: DUF599 domain-containing protein [Nitrospinae bacterium]|nr:DUF599 domain-containing protein [Nitrospinota bacterium]